MKEALAQPEQERCVGCEACIDTACGRDECPKGWPKAAQPEQEPEFIKHEVENAEDWSEWVCPNPHKYLMKCCDCGLVHEAQFGVVRYKSEEEREACDFVDDPNMQAVFRMRRSEQWSPEDTAHRAGGLPMEQPEQEPVACPECKRLEDELEHANIKATVWKSAYDVEVGHNEQDTTPPQRTWVGLTDEEANELWESTDSDWELMKRTEAKLKEKNT